MSDPKLERAGGCGVIFSLIVATILVFAFFFIRQCVPVGEQAPLDQREQDERRRKVEAHRLEEGNFTATIDAFHAEKNSTLEEVMQTTTDRYVALREANATGPVVPDANATEEKGDRQ